MRAAPPTPCPWRSWIVPVLAASCSSPTPLEHTPDRPDTSDPADVVRGNVTVELRSGEVSHTTSAIAQVASHAPGDERCAPSVSIRLVRTADRPPRTLTVTPMLSPSEGTGLIEPGNPLRGVLIVEVQSDQGFERYYDVSYRVVEHSPSAFEVSLPAPRRCVATRRSDLDAMLWHSDAACDFGVPTTVRVQARVPDALAPSWCGEGGMSDWRHGTEGLCYSGAEVPCEGASPSDGEDGMEELGTSRRGRGR